MCFMCSATQTFDPLRHPGQGPDAALITETTDAAGDTSTTYVMSSGDTFAGSISSALDDDWVSIELTAGTTYQVTITGGTLGDAEVALFDSSGNSVNTGDGNGRDTVTTFAFTADSTGTFYISGQSAGGNTGSYSISVTGGTAPPPPPPPTGGVGTLDELANFLTNGYWDGTNRAARSFDTTADNVISVNISGLTAAGQQLARWAFEAWELVADLDFVETLGSADITFDDNDSGAYAFSDVTGGTINYSVVNISTAWIGTYGTTIDSYSFATYIHEIGHALGLGHQGAYNGSATYGVDETFSNDSWQISVMSYFNQNENTSVNASYAALISTMMSDIVAIQNLYGASDVTVGNTTWGVGSNLPGYMGSFFNGAPSSTYGGANVAFTIYDDGGIDHLDLSNSTTNDRVDMRDTSFSDVYGLTGNLAIARDTDIEHLTTGSGNDTITGNDGANRIISGLGGDSIMAGEGDDTLNGGGGADALDGGADTDTADYSDSTSGVTVRLWNGTGLGGDAEGDTLTEIENIIGSAYRDFLIGSYGVSNVLDGGGGNDNLRGLSGADVLIGGAGTDTADYGSSNSGVTVRLWNGTGQRGHAEGDTLTEIENIIGSAYRDFLIGSYGASNVLDGGGGNDYLRGLSGDDTLTGGTGADDFVFRAGAGTDNITDFTDTEDRLIFLGGLTFADLSRSQVGSDVVITYGSGDQIILENMLLSQLTQDDMTFLA